MIGIERRLDLDLLARVIEVIDLDRLGAENMVTLEDHTVGSRRDRDRLPAGIEEPDPDPTHLRVGAVTGRANRLAAGSFDIDRGDADLAIAIAISEVAVVLDGRLALREQL